MLRRDFLKLSSICAAALVLGSELQASFPSVNSYEKVIGNVFLDGGPDFRFLFVPKPTESDTYSQIFWAARISLYTTSDISGYSSLISNVQKAVAVYDNYYTDVTLSGKTFGVLKTCGWLIDEINKGNVAIVNNVVASKNRDHHHSKLMMESGNLEINSHNSESSGWGGRAAAILGGNVVSMSRNVRTICNGPHSSGDINKHENSNVISAPDTRNFSLYKHDTAALIANGDNSYRYSSSKILGRALEGYYAAKREAVNDNSPYKVIFNHEKSVRDFGSKVDAVIENQPIPTAFDSSLDSYKVENVGLGNIDGTNDYFAKQLLSLYDSFACQNIFKMRFASLEYPGWDTHKVVETQAGDKLKYMFGQDLAFSAWQNALASVAQDALNKTVFAVYGEFGRQLKANGSEGSDHGKGNSILIFGNAVNGGIYGELFPEDEITINQSTQKHKFDTPNSDIEGKTSIFRVFSRLLDWQQVGLGQNVFGDLSGTEIETSLDLSNLLQA